MIFSHFFKVGLNKCKPLLNATFNIAASFADVTDNYMLLAHIVTLDYTTRLTSSCKTCISISLAVNLDNILAHA